MKRLFSFSVLVILIFNLFTCAYAEDAKIIVSSEINGSDVIVNVALKNNPGFIAFSIDTKYDRNILTPTSVIEGDLLTNGGDSITSNINGSVYTADFVSAVWASLKEVNSDGNLFTVSFKLAEGYAGSKTTINVICNEFLTSEKTFIQVAPFDAKIIIPSTTESHVNRPALMPTITLKGNADTIRYMNDYGDEFKPLEYATRYEIIDALYNLFDIKNTDKNLSFTDVSENYKNKVSAFVSVGVVNGYEDGTFGGEKQVTRAEFVKLLTTAFNLIENSYKDIFFNDIATHWAKDHINTFAIRGYAKGYENSDGTFSFKPDEFVTRSEAVAFINRIINARGKASEKVYTDLPSDYWASSEIIKVVN